MTNLLINGVIKLKAKNYQFNIKFYQLAFIWIKLDFLLLLLLKLGIIKNGNVVP